MPSYLQSLPEHELRSMARSATDMFLSGKGSLEDTIVKVAQACDSPLSSEHVRRICEMSYHDTYERMFKSASAGEDRLVNFTPANALAVIQRLNVETVSTFQDKVASSVTGDTILEKVASSSGSRWEEFLSSPDLQGRDAYAEHTASEKVASTEWQDLEDASLIKTAAQALEDAAHDLELRLDAARGSMQRDFTKLAEFAVQTHRWGSSPEDIITAAVLFAKEAQCSDAACGHLADGLIGLLQKEGWSPSRSTGGTKVASVAQLNPKSPLNAWSVKAASGADRVMQIESALGDVLAQRDTLKQASVTGKAWKRVQSLGKGLAGAVDVASGGRYLRTKGRQNMELGRKLQGAAISGKSPTPTVTAGSDSARRIAQEGIDLERRGRTQHAVGQVAPVALGAAGVSGGALLAPVAYRKLKGRAIKEASVTSAVWQGAKGLGRGLVQGVDALSGGAKMRARGAANVRAGRIMQGRGPDGTLPVQPLKSARDGARIERKGRWQQFKGYAAPIGIGVTGVGGVAMGVPAVAKQVGQNQATIRQPLAKRGW